MMKKVLFIENEIMNDNKMSTCYNIKCQKIKNLYKFYNIGSGEIINYDDYDVALFGCRSIYIYKVYKGTIKIRLKENFEKIVDNIKEKYFIIQDMHQKTYGSIEKLCEILNKNKFNIIFTFYNNTEAKIIRKLTPNCKYHHLHHHIDTNIFKIHNEKDIDKDIDILLFGSIHPKHYPFRKRLFDLILNNKDKFSKIYFIEYDSSVFNPEHCEVGLSKLLNNSKICIATKSRYDYLVGKYFEISASGCLIAGDIPTDGKEILDNNILELTNSMSDDEIINKLTNCINNYEMYKDKINKLKNIVDTYYNLDKYIEKIINIIY